jgi:hypothetical protein
MPQRKIDVGDFDDFHERAESANLSRYCSDSAVFEYRSKGECMPTSLVRNERIKLMAGALNTVGIATIVTAVVVPNVTFVYCPAWLLVGVLWLIVGLSLHVLALVTLGRLMP